MVGGRSEGVRSPRAALVGALGLLVALLVLPLALAPHAEAYIYWAESGKDTIGRAKLNGTGVDRKFLDAPAIPAMTVDARHIYWTTYGDAGVDAAGVRRAKIDGTGIDSSYITRLVPLSCARTCNGLGDLAVDAGHIYGTGAFSHTIGRANLGGTGVNQNFITTSSPLAVAADASHVYWTSPHPTIGRANLDGTGVDEQFISGLGRAIDIAVGAGHVYWTTERRTIGRANLDGTGVDQNFINIASGSTLVRRLAIDDNHIYWNNYLEGTIGRANLDGTGVDSHFISGLDHPSHIAVNALRPVGNVTAERTQRQRGKKIRVNVRVKAKQPLTARVTGKVEINPTYTLRPTTMKVAKGRAKTLKVKPRNKAQAKEIAGALKRGEKATAKLKVKLTDRAGNRETERLPVRLKRR